MKKLFFALIIIALITSCERSTRGNWTQSDKNKLGKMCKEEIKSITTDDAALNKFCDCVTGKAENKYSSFNDLDRKGSEEVGYQFGQDCAKELIED